MNALPWSPLFAAALLPNEVGEVTRAPGTGRDMLILLLVSGGWDS